MLDEAQKITAWSDVVKRLWDEDTAAGTPLRVVLLGSAPMLVQRGLSDSLAGRFELIRVPHWSYPEMRDGFDLDLDEYLYFGGYPGAADLIADRDRWANYILDALVETTLSRDVLLLTRVDKTRPAPSGVPAGLRVLGPDRLVPEDGRAAGRTQATPRPSRTTWSCSAGPAW